jgi:hypothetical protein
MQVDFPGDRPAPSPPDALVPVRGGLGALLVIAGAVVLAWTLLLTHGYLNGTSAPGLEGRLTRIAAEESARPGANENAGAVMLAAAPVITLLALSLLASIGGRMIVTGAGLLQPDWTQILRRFEQSIAALRSRP